MQPDYIYCKYNVYIALIYLAWKAVVITINCLFGTLYKSLWVLLAKSINISGVPCPKRDIEGCFSLECERNGRSGKSLSGSWECHVCGDLVFLSSNICRKTSFRVDNIIELLLKQSRDIVKFVAGPFPDVYLKALLFFLEVSLRW